MKKLNLLLPQSISMALDWVTAQQIRCQLWMLRVWNFVCVRLAPMDYLAVDLGALLVVFWLASST
jgi:hypothetical protein